MKVVLITAGAAALGGWWWWIRPIEEGAVRGPKSAAGIQWRVMRAFPAGGYSAAVYTPGFGWVMLAAKFSDAGQARGAAVEKAASLAGTLVVGLAA